MTMVLKNILKYKMKMSNNMALNQKKMIYGQSSFFIGTH